MSGDQPAYDIDDLVYMVSGENENGDTVIFVTSNLERAEARRLAMLTSFCAVKANWLDNV